MTWRKAKAAATGSTPRRIHRRAIARSRTEEQIIRTLCKSISALALVVGLGQPALASETDRAKAGAALVTQHCSRCHAVAADDRSSHKDAPPFRTFAAKWPLENLEEALAEGIVTGHPDMPTFVFEPAEIDVVIEYLHALGQQAGDASSATETKGR